MCAWICRRKLDCGLNCERKTNMYILYAVCVRSDSKRRRIVIIGVSTFQLSIETQIQKNTLQFDRFNLDWKYFERIERTHTHIYKICCSPAVKIRCQITCTITDCGGIKKPKIITRQTIYILYVLGVCVLSWTTKGICDVKYGDLKTKITDRKCQTVLLRDVTHSHSQFPCVQMKSWTEEDFRKSWYYTKYGFLIGFSVSLPCM